MLIVRGVSRHQAWILTVFTSHAVAGFRAWHIITLAGASVVLLAS